MKIKLNLAVAPTTHERYALAWSAPVALVALAVMVWLVLSAMADLRATRGLAVRLADAERRGRELSQRETELRKSLDRPELGGTLREAQFVNSLILQKQLSLSGLTVRVADLLPPDARLSALALARSNNDSMVRFEVTSRNPQALEQFLSNLADSADFQDPIITSEGFERQASSPGEITLACSARYVGVREGGNPAASPK